MNESIVMVSGAGTPMGGFQGVFSNVTAPALGSVATRVGAVSRSVLG